MLLFDLFVDVHVVVVVKCAQLVLFFKYATENKILRSKINKIEIKYQTV